MTSKANFILEEIRLTTSDIFRILLKKVVNTGEVSLSLISKKSYFNESQNKQVNQSLDEIEQG